MFWKKKNFSFSESGFVYLHMALNRHATMARSALEYLRAEEKSTTPHKRVGSARCTVQVIEISFKKLGFNFLGKN